LEEASPWRNLHQPRLSLLEARTSPKAAPPTDLTGRDDLGIFSPSAYYFGCGTSDRTILHRGHPTWPAPLYSFSRRGLSKGSMVTGRTTRGKRGSLPAARGKRWRSETYGAPVQGWRLGFAAMVLSPAAKNGRVGLIEVRQRIGRSARCAGYYRSERSPRPRGIVGYRGGL
jgi:hypothetical protein